MRCCRSGRRARVRRLDPTPPFNFYKLIRDLFIFTDKRLVLVDKQGLTGSKIEYHSLPYRAITHFSIETGGHFDLDAELKVWVSGSSTPFQKTFNKRLSIYEVQSVLASYVLK